jgi:arylsulfatase A-like enzyme
MMPTILAQPVKGSEARSAKKMLRALVGSSAASLVAALVLGGCSEAPPSSADVAPPNVLFVVLDTTRADHFLSAVWNDGRTPGLAAFARDAVHYSQARSASPWTLPSHMSLFTGLHPGEHGANWSAFHEHMNRKFRIAEPERLLPRLLGELGYSTIGVSDNPWISERTGFDEGFDVLYPAWISNAELQQWVHARPANAAPAVDRLNHELGVNPAFDRGLAGRAALLMETHLEQLDTQPPFFAFLNLIDPHYPYLAPPQFSQAFEGDQDIYDMLANPDLRPDELSLMTGVDPLDLSQLVPFYDSAILYTYAAVDQLISWLREKGYYDDTLIVITSDHGEHLGEGGRFSHQLSTEEELLHVPLFIKYPGPGGEGREDSTLKSLLDVYDIVLEAAGSPAAGQTRELPWVMAEYYWSEAYFKNLLNFDPDFDAEPHRVVRRVVYEDGVRYSFRDDSLESVVPLEAGAPSPAPKHIRRVEERLAAWVAELARRTRGGLIEELADPVQLDALRELGYLGGPSNGERRDAAPHPTREEAGTDGPGEATPPR